MNKYFELKRISDSRLMIMGLATLWIALFHSVSLDFFKSNVLVTMHLSGTFDYIQSIGNFGVDIFLFLSGYGLWYSFSKNMKIKEFYKRRFIRVIPSVLIVSLISYGWFKADGFSDYASKLFLYGFFDKTHTRGIYWYFSLLIVLYLLYPVFHKIIDKTGLAGVLCLTAFFVLAAFLLKHIDSTYFYKIEIALTRVPVFIAGIWFGKKAAEGAKIKYPIGIIISVLFIAYLVILKHITLPTGYEFLKRYLYYPMVILLVITVSFINIHIKKNKFRRIIEFFGYYSLEFYLIYESVYLASTGLFKASDGAGISYAAACFSVSILLSIALKQSVNHIMNFIRKDNNE